MQHDTIKYHKIVATRRWAIQFIADFTRLNRRSIFSGPGSLECGSVFSRCRYRNPSMTSSDQRAYTHSINAAFALQANRRPDAIAVKLGDEILTYRQLHERSNQLARFLRRCGNTDGAIVGLVFDRSIQMLVAMLGIVKAGAAYLPIDPTYPLDRVAMIFADASPSLILTEERQAKNVPTGAAQVVRVDREQELIARESAADVADAPQSERLAYVIYTSGSTGQPKGVMVSHRNVLRLLTTTDPWFGFGASDVWSLFHSVAFDFSVWEIWGCLLRGGKLVIVPYEVSRSPRDFYDLLAREGVTVLNQTPAAFYQLIGVEAAGRHAELALRHVIFGGEALNFKNLRPWFQAHGDANPRLVNMYGITETTVHVTYRPITMADAATESRSLIGIPIPDLRIYLLDSEQRPVTPGSVGEIYVGGGGVALGYLNRSELTAERFVKDPFADRIDAKMYRSGDMARQLDNGDLEYLGRIDRQLKVRGFRIEPGEIEAALLEYPGVSQATVCARTEESEQNRLAAYLVMKAGHNLVISELRAFLRTKLPGHMVPHDYLQIEAIPLTINGKVDRDALPAPRTGLESAQAGQPPVTELERVIAGVWSKVLGLQTFGLSENFFDLGGDSLLLVQLQAELEKALQISISSTDMFEFTTVRKMARHSEGRSLEQDVLYKGQERMQRQREFAARRRSRVAT